MEGGQDGSSQSARSGSRNHGAGMLLPYGPQHNSTTAPTAGGRCGAVPSNGQLAVTSSSSARSLMLPSIIRSPGQWSGSPYTQFIGFMVARQ